MSDITWVIVLPLIGAFLLPTLPGVWLRNLLGIGILVVDALLALNAALHYQAPYVVTLGDFAAPLGIDLYVDPLALLFALLVPLTTLLLWPGPGEDAATRRQSLTLILVASLCGLALSGDLFNIYVWYELAAVASYGLIAGSGGTPAYVAGFRYLLLSALCSMIGLVGISLIYFQTGTVNLAQLSSLHASLTGPVGLTAFVLLLISFGVKAELFPVNGWVPEVYASSNKRLTALLAGLASKLAVLVLVRFLVLIFPGEETRQLMLILGILGVAFGELAAWQARDVTRMLSWSSVGQLGVVFIAFSIPGKAGLIAGVVVAVHHLVVKSGLFLLADRWGGAIHRLGGAARRSALGAGLFLLFGLSLLGVPPLPGFWSKYLVLSGLAGEGTGLALLAMAVVLIGTVLEAAYLMRVARHLYSNNEQPEAATQRPLNLLSSSVFGATLIVGTLLVSPAWHGLNKLAATATDRPAYIATVLGTANAAKETTR